MAETYQWGGDPEDYNTGFMASVFDTLGRVNPADRFQPRPVRDRPAPPDSPLYRLLAEHQDDRDKYYMDEHFCSCDEMVEDHAAHLTEVLEAYLKESRRGSIDRTRESVRRLATRALVRLRLRES